MNPISKWLYLRAVRRILREHRDRPCIILINMQHPDLRNADFADMVRRLEEAMSGPPHTVH